MIGAETRLSALETRVEASTVVKHICWQAEHTASIAGVSTTRCRPLEQDVGLRSLAMFSRGAWLVRGFVWVDVTSADPMGNL
jgi:hypothetical protein